MTAQHTRLLTGARPTGSLHIGHYFGALRPFLAVENRSDSYFVVADLHMLTTRFDYQTTRGLGATIHRLVAECIALGIDESETSFYLQSDVPEQAQIYSIVQSLVSYGQLEKQVSFLEMIRHSKAADPSLGLLGYPVLETSDVLSIQPTHVTVGEHNLAHLELCRAVIRRLRDEWDLQLALPEPLSGGLNLVGLDGAEKMSKSLGNAIFLRDSADDVRKKIGAMPIVVGGRNVPLEYFALVLPNDLRARRLAEAAVTSDSDARRVREFLADALNAFLDPVRRRLAELDGDPRYVDELLAAGVERARAIASTTLDRLVEGLGIPRYAPSAALGQTLLHDVTHEDVARAEAPEGRRRRLPSGSRRGPLWDTNLRGGDG